MNKDRLSITKMLEKAKCIYSNLRKNLKYRDIAIMLALSIFFMIFVQAIFILSEKKPSASGNIHYVSKGASGLNNGTSWANAWNEMNQINWSVVNPGDTILIYGGSTEMVYTTMLNLTKSGTAGNPITLKKATESGRNGTVRIFGAEIHHYLIVDN
jgi:hypothetical protein